MSDLSLSHSGCLLTTEDDGGLSIVKKIAHDDASSHRLLQQINKQQQHRELLDGAVCFFDVPEILEQGNENNLAYFTMPYIAGPDCANLLKSASKPLLDEIFEGVKSLIEFYISQSTTISISKQVLIDKVISIKAKPDLISQIKGYVSECVEEQLTLPIGYCHGDLAFANILFKSEEHKFYLIDFLDTFIESPLQDIVKIRQDTRHKWVMRLLRSKGTVIPDENQMLINLGYVDGLVQDYFLKYEWYSKYYKVFQVINLARILPYTTNDDVQSYLQQELEMLMEIA